MHELGIIGFGNIGRTHFKGLEEVAEARVAAIADPSKERQEAARGLGLAAYDDWKGMLDGRRLDAVLVCTPPAAHFAPAAEALQRGLHVFVEKPMTVGAADSKKLVALAEARKRHLTVGFAHRFRTPIIWAKEQIEGGAIGRVVMFRNRFSGHFAGVEKLWFSKRALAGGGAMMDTAVHSIDLFRYLVGEVKGVAGFQAQLFPEKLEVEDTVAMILQGESGALGTIEASWATTAEFNVTVYGAKGTIRFNYGLTATCQLEGEAEPTPSPAQEGNPFAAQMQHFVSVLQGEPPIVTGRDGLRVAEIVDAFYEGARG